MTPDDTLGRLRGLIIDELMLPVDPAWIVDRTPLFEGGLRLESIDLIELGSLLEREFGVAIGPWDPATVAALDTVGSLAARIDGEAMPPEATGGVIRTGAGVWRPAVRAFRVDTPRGLRGVEQLLSVGTDLLDGEGAQGLLLDESGRPLADLACYREDGGWWLLAEGECEELASLGVEVAPPVSVAGPWAWQVLEGLAGEGSASMLPMSLLRTAPDRLVLRGRRTAEHSFDLLVSDPEAVTAALLEAEVPCSVVSDVEVAQARFVDRVFDPAVEGASGLDAVELGLHCRLDSERGFRGAQAARARLEGGGERVLALRSEGSASDAPLHSGGGRWLGRVERGDGCWALAAVPEGGAEAGHGWTPVRGAFETPTSVWVRPGIDRYPARRPLEPRSDRPTVY